MTPVTRLTGLLVALVLAAGVLGPAAAVTSSYGHTSARDGRLRDGCHNYGYHYAVRTPTNDWTLETFLVDRTGEHIASGVLLSDSEPRRGQAVFRFCRYATKPGRFTIRAKVHWYVGFSEEHTARFEPSHFRLRRG